MQYKMTVQELKHLNSLKSDMIYVGQKLKVSGKATVAAPPPAPAAPPVTPPVQPEKTTEYTVKSGDTLGAISSTVYNDGCRN